MQTRSPSLEYDHAMSVMQRKVAMTPDMVDQRERVMRALRLRSGERVLEVGCGNGLLAGEMARQVGLEGRITGVDISAPMIAMARDANIGRANVEFTKADAARLPFADASFDAAVTVQCLCFVPDVRLALAEVFRVLRPGGRLVVLDTDWDTLVWNSDRPDLMRTMTEIYKAVYVDARLPRSLSKHLLASGFDLTSREQFAILNWQLDADSYSGHQIAFTREVALASDPAAQIDLWIDSIRSVAEAGCYFFNLNRYIFSATRRP